MLYCRECPDDLTEAIATIIYCSKRIEIPELTEVDYMCVITDTDTNTNSNTNMVVTVVLQTMLMLCHDSDSDWLSNGI
jgi:hypothetical protein